MQAFVKHLTHDDHFICGEGAAPNAGLSSALLVAWRGLRYPSHPFRPHRHGLTNKRERALAHQDQAMQGRASSARNARARRFPILDSGVGDPHPAQGTPDRGFRADRLPSTIRDRQLLHCERLTGPADAVAVMKGLPPNIGLVL